MPTKKTTKKSVAKKAPAKKTAKAPAKKAVAKKVAAKKTEIKKAEVKKAVAKKPAVEKPLKQGRRKLVKDSQSHDKDTGSTDVQIALLTGKINDLAKHLKDHPKDHDSRQGLLKMVGRRRRLMNFLRAGDDAKYQALVKDLKLRK